MKRIRPRKEVLEKMYLEEKLSCEEIARHFNVTPSAVSVWRRHYGMAPIERWERTGLSKDLLEEESSVVVGSTLGDGNIRHNKGYPGFRFSQCREHHGYVRWMANRLKRWLNRAGVVFRSRVTNCFGKNQIQHSVSFETIRHPAFLPYRNWFYDENGVKHVPENIKDLLTPLSLCVWYCDDGGFSDSPMLYTCAFSEKDHSVLQAALWDKFRITTSVGWSRMKDGRKYRHLLAHKKPWLNVVGDLVWKIPCMRKKLPKNYFPS